MRERPVVDGDLRDAATVTISDGVVRVESTAHAHTLRQDLLEFRRRSARDERANQRQRVVVEICLQNTNRACN